MNETSHYCSGGDHRRCPGYYLTASPCRCGCHKAKAACTHDSLGICYRCGIDCHCDDCESTRRD